MSVPEISIDIIGFNNQKINITIVSASASDPLFVLEESEALTQGESPYQIQEGRSYEFRISKGFTLKEIPGIVSASRLEKNLGRITPNIYVGTLPIEIIESNTGEKCGEFKLEVQSVKTSYREDYRLMLEEIAERCTDLLMQHSSPVLQTFTIDFEKDAATAYQRFAFIKSIIDSEEFESAIHKVVSAPTTNWAETLSERPIDAVRKFDKKVVRQLAASPNRIKAPSIRGFTHPTIPAKLTVSDKEETVDTPENRFVKFALESFSYLCGNFTHLKDNARVKEEALQLEEKLEQYLNHSIFKEVSSLSTIPLNSPVLQRKEGYREIFRTWLLLDLAAKLIWAGGDDIYFGGKRDVSVLYEYWLFFKLIDAVTAVFQLPSINPEELIEETADGLGLKLKQGKFLAIKGVYHSGTRSFNIQLSYNRTYSGDQPYPKPGSWSRNLRPDYTLSIWPLGVSDSQAEEEELIVHIHFDAKYKIENFQEIVSNTVPLDEEKEEQRKGTVKKVDLLKMHAYRDAIRRTAGAYVLYPGHDFSQTKKGFHEIVPGLGAFAIRPSKTDSGMDELKGFLVDIAIHINNRASQREHMSYKTYENYKESNTNQLNELLPETVGNNRNLLPDETYVLIAYYRGKEHLKWIEKEKLYNARTGSTRGSLHLSPKEIGARYLLLHSNGETKTSKLYKLSEKGLRIFSKKDLLNKKYPSTPSQDFYLVFEIEGQPEEEFHGMTWDITQLVNYKGYRESTFPFAASLNELMQVLWRNV